VDRFADAELAVNCAHKFLLGCELILVGS
jgi:hypothetical protein